MALSAAEQAISRDQPWSTLFFHPISNQSLEMRSYQQTPKLQAAKWGLNPNTSSVVHNCEPNTLCPAYKAFELYTYRRIIWKSGREKRIKKKRESKISPCKWPLWLYFTMGEFCAQGQENSRGLFQKKRSEFPHQNT